MLAEEAIKKAIEDVKVKNDEKKEWEHKWLKIIDYENESRKDSHQKTLKFNLFISLFSFCVIGDNFYSENYDLFWL